MTSPHWIVFAGVGRKLARVVSWAWLISLFIFAYPVVIIGAYRADVASNWSIHSWRVQSKLQAIWALTAEAEASQRAFVLTHSRSYLRTFDHAAEELDLALGRLVAITSDNKDQIKNGEAIRDVVLEKVRFLRRVNRTYDEQGTEAAAQLIRSGVGTRLLGEIRDRIARMSQEESALYEQRMALYNRWIHAVQVAGFAIFMIDVSRIALFWYYYGQELRKANVARGATP